MTHTVLFIKKYPRAKPFPVETIEHTHSDYNTALLAAKIRECNIAAAEGRGFPEFFTIDTDPVVAVLTPVVPEKVPQKVEVKK